ncbi:MAG: hypothetical protein JKY43_06790 [Phycisphaerales bacterium]|nr:hypothetical protein [Phycisphaerales bacterium]
MFPEIERTLFTKDQIAARVKELAQEIVRDLETDLAKDDHSLQDENRVIIIPIMTGAMIFVADLIRELPVKLSLGLTSVRSYPGASISSKGAHLESDLPDNLTGKHIVVLDDILDSGQTLALVKAIILKQNPASLRLGVMLDKQTPRTIDVKCDYVGFQIPDEFVVGYGLDYDGYYRNHPEIVILNQNAIPKR